MMDRNPNSRMTLQEAMAHPFFAILQWKHVAQRKYTRTYPVIYLRDRNAEYFF